ncbi:hypothetical protein LR48_Vigan05g069300 [Vigna angularis]|uniref:Uncharacterized protein n=1 Tax=Phaseolus angularis TaxID=3914 RepID=A0A0L9UKK8_PHAAN|nr:hypothetical protein LR48_Vigan05g069300 [Vigna angularis]
MHEQSIKLITAVNKYPNTIEAIKRNNDSSTAFAGPCRREAAAIARPDASSSPSSNREAFSSILAAATLQATINHPLPRPITILARVSRQTATINHHHRSSSPSVGTPSIKTARTSHPKSRSSSRLSSRVRQSRTTNIFATAQQPCSSPPPSSTATFLHGNQHLPRVAEVQDHRETPPSRAPPPSQDPKRPPPTLRKTKNRTPPPRASSPQRRKREQKCSPISNLQKRKREQERRGKPFPQF